MPPPPVVIADRATFATLMERPRWARPHRARGRHRCAPESPSTGPERSSTTLACGTRRRRGAGVVRRRAAADPHGLRQGRRRRQRRGARRRRARRPSYSGPPALRRRSGARASRPRSAAGVWPVAGFAALAGVGLVAAAGVAVVRPPAPGDPAADGPRRVAGRPRPQGGARAGRRRWSLGAAAGVALAYGLVAWLGPSPTIEPRRRRRGAAGGRGALRARRALVIGGVVVGAVRAPAGRGGAGPARGSASSRGSWCLAAWRPWCRTGGWASGACRSSQGAEVSRVDVLGLLFPVLFLVDRRSPCVVPAARARAPARCCAASREWPTPLYLAVRRVARYRAAVLGLVAASALAAGVLGYAATIHRSMDATLAGQGPRPSSAATWRSAADRRAGPRGAARPVDRGRRLPPGVGGATARREDVTVLAIDPATFARAAFWDASLSPTRRSRSILDRLAAPPRDGRVPGAWSWAPTSCPTSPRPGSPDVRHHPLRDRAGRRGARRSPA